MSTTQPSNLEDCIRSEWGNLSEEEIALVRSDTERFQEAVNEKYSLTRAEIQRQLREWDRECMQAA